jgi:DNA-binding NtrC family response regulator
LVGNLGISSHDLLLLRNTGNKVASATRDHAIKDAVDFIAKPFDPDKVLGIVKKTIG